MERLNAIYLTPDFEFAFALAVRTKGQTKISWGEKTICFGNSEEFDPEEEVYIYVVDPSKIPDEKKLWVNKKQIAVVNIAKIEPEKIIKRKAGEICQYYSMKQSSKSRTS